jgi:hypothetical protein
MQLYLALLGCRCKINAMQPSRKNINGDRMDIKEGVFVPEKISCSEIGFLFAGKKNVLHLLPKMLSFKGVGEQGNLNLFKLRM